MLALPHTSSFNHSFRNLEFTNHKIRNLSLINNPEQAGTPYTSSFNHPFWNLQFRIINESKFPGLLSSMGKTNLVPQAINEHPNQHSWIRWHPPQ